MGCVGISGGKECNYWVHSVCKVFGDTSEEEVQKLNFYCLKHNNQVETMRLEVSTKHEC